MECRLMVSAAVALLFGTGLAHAIQLSKAWTPLTAKEVRAVYSGKTAQWSKTTVYFGPDGNIMGHDKKKTTVFSGTWSVSANRACMNVVWKVVKTGKSGKATDCWDWYSGDHKMWTLWSKHYDGSKPGKDDYYAHEIKKLKAGNLVAKEYARLTQ